MIPTTPTQPFRARLARAPNLAALLAALLLVFCFLPAFAAPPAAPADTEAVLGAARKQIDEIRKRVPDETDDAVLLKQRGEALDIQSKADAATEALTPQLASVTARLSELGTPPDGAKEAPDVAAQRAQLEKNSRALDAQIKLARLLSVDAGQTAEQISAQRRKQFQARLGERRDSFLSGQFWAADPHRRLRNHPAVAAGVCRCGPAAQHRGAKRALGFSGGNGLGRTWRGPLARTADAADEDPRPEYREACEVGHPVGGWSYLAAVRLSVVCRACMVAGLRRGAGQASHAGCTGVRTPVEVNPNVRLVNRRCDVRHGRSAC